MASSDASIATADSIGKVTAIKEGQAIITAQISGSETKTACSVTATPKPVETTTSSAVVLNIDPEKTQIHLKETVSLVKSNTNYGELRFILASKGLDNVVEAREVLIIL